MDEKQEILKTLEPLFVRAEKEKLWFYCRYQDLWFSPKELKEYNNQNRFVWGAVNWTLREPHEKILEIEKDIKKLEDLKEEFIKRMEKVNDARIK